MPDNIENTVGLQFCLWKENNKVNSVPKGNTYPLYLNKRNEFLLMKPVWERKAKIPSIQWSRPDGLLFMTFL